MPAGEKKPGTAGCLSRERLGSHCFQPGAVGALLVASVLLGSDQEASSDARISAQRPKAKAALLKPA